MRAFRPACHMAFARGPVLRHSARPLILSGLPGPVGFAGLTAHTMNRLCGRLLRASLCFEGFAIGLYKFGNGLRRFSGDLLDDLVSAFEDAVLVEPRSQRGRDIRRPRTDEATICSWPNVISSQWQLLLREHQVQVLNRGAGCALSKIIENRRQEDVPVLHARKYAQAHVVRTV